MNKTMSTLKYYKNIIKYYKMLQNIILLNITKYYKNTIREIILFEYKFCNASLKYQFIFCRNFSHTNKVNSYILIFISTFILIINNIYVYIIRMKN